MKLIRHPGLATVVNGKISTTEVEPCDLIRYELVCDACKAQAEPRIADQILWANNDDDLDKVKTRDAAMRLRQTGWQRIHGKDHCKPCLLGEPPL